MNEADFHLTTWKQDFYGSKNARLRAIEAKYDPNDLFYATTAVNSVRGMLQLTEGCVVRKMARFGASGELKADRAFGSRESGIA